MPLWAQHFASISAIFFGQFRNLLRGSHEETLPPKARTIFVVVVVACRIQMVWTPQSMMKMTCWCSLTKKRPTGRILRLVVPKIFVDSRWWSSVGTSEGPEAAVAPSDCDGDREYDTLDDQVPLALIVVVLDLVESLAHFLCLGENPMCLLDPMDLLNWDRRLLSARTFLVPL